MSPPELPQELLDAIVDRLDPNDHALLKACSVVSRAFYLRARKLLFQTISLYPDRCLPDGAIDSTTSTYTAFQKLLDISPNVISLVRRFALDLGGPRSDLEVAPFARLGESFDALDLEMLTIKSTFQTGIRWRAEGRTIPIASAFFVDKLLTRPSNIRYLTLCRIKISGEMLFFLAQCANLKELEVEGFSFQDGVYPWMRLHEMNVDRPQIEVLTLRATEPVVFQDNYIFAMFVGSMVSEKARWAEVGRLRRIVFQENSASRGMHYRPLQRLLGLTTKSLLEFRWKRMVCDIGPQWNELVYTGDEISSINLADA